ncbi:unnamed protein product [Closterium sp. NIES-64]|nr:unnamed protein product [Closterium sp. NIES-64]
MGRSKLLIWLALSLVVSLALAPLCRADEIVAEDDAAFDADAEDPTEISAASEPGFLSKLFGGSRRFLWSPQAHRMLHSCKQKCEKTNKKSAGASDVEEGADNTQALAGRMRNTVV